LQRRGQPFAGITWRLGSSQLFSHSRVPAHRVVSR
jgi:hypothetical protein